MAVATVHSKWVNGELVFYDGANELFHVPNGSGLSLNWQNSPGIVSHHLYTRFHDDFVAPGLDGSGGLIGWTLTAVEAGAGSSTVMAQGDGAGGMIKLDSAGAENDGCNLQVNGEAFILASGKPCYFGASIRVVEEIQSDIIVGLCITDTDVVGAVTDGLYFRSVDTAATLTAVAEKNNTETENTEIAAFAKDTWYTVEFFFDGAGTITPYIDGVAGTAITTNIPDDEYLTPTLAHLNGDATQHDGLLVRWIDVVGLD